MGIGISIYDKSWEFEPQEDITTWELAQCLSILIEGFVAPKGKKDAEFEARLMAVKRHFRVE